MHWLYVYIVCYILTQSAIFTLKSLLFQGDANRELTATDVSYIALELFYMILFKLSILCLCTRALRLYLKATKDVTSRRHQRRVACLCIYVALVALANCAFFHVFLPSYYVYAVFERNLPQNSVVLIFQQFFTELSFTIVLIMASTIYMFVAKSTRLARMA